MSNRYVNIALDPVYWVEHINNDMYDAMITYMEENKLNQTQFAKFLGISKGRLSQILNSGEINFTIEKLCTIALKIDKIPKLELQDKDLFVKSTICSYTRKVNITYGQNLSALNTFKTQKSDNVIRLQKNTSFQLKYS